MESNNRSRLNGLQWKVISFCVAIIVVGHLLEEARGYGWMRAFPNYWEFIYHFADNSVAIAFATITCWVIWFLRNNLLVFLVAVALGVANWCENELKSRAFFGSFLQTVDWWQWSGIDATIAVLVAIFLKPFVRKLNLADGIVVQALSISDLLLATLASAVWIVSTRSIATKSSQLNPNVLDYGWPFTFYQCMMAILFSCVGAAAVYVVTAFNWKRGLLVFIGVSFVFLIASQAAFTRNGQLEMKLFKSPDLPLLFGFLAVVTMLAIGMLAIRFAFNGTRLDPRQA